MYILFTMATVCLQVEDKRHWKQGTAIHFVEVGTIVLAIAYYTKILYPVE